MKSQTQLVGLAALLCSLYLAAAQDANLCPDGTQPATCTSANSIGRCAGASCPAIPNVRCIPNACENCEPNFFDGDSNVTENCRDCPSGRVLNECGSPCPPTCDIRVPICAAVCAAGCFCPDDMVLNDVGECISPSDCPVDPTDPCATVRCAEPNCGDGTDPVTTNLQCCPVCPACLDDTGQLVEAGEIEDSDDSPCTSCFCTERGEVACLSVVCAPFPEECPDGTVPVTDEDECCPRCQDPCELVDCAIPECRNEAEPFIPPGECCYQCPNDPCATVRCASPTCADGTDPIIREGQCCPVCRRCLDSDGERRPAGEIVNLDDPCSFCSCTLFGGINCAVVDCPFPDTCPDGNEPVVREGQCCATCETSTTPNPCATVLCAQVDECPDGSDPVTPSGECCPRCSTCIGGDGTVYPVGSTFSDGCNTCYCLATGGIICTLRECPDPCSLPAQSGICLAYFPRYYYDSSTETCQRFIYGGCGGNDNNFETAHDCLVRCNPDSICLRPIYPENFQPVCEVLSRQWTFNSRTGRCEVINYAECGERRGGYNVFRTQRECNNTCIDARPRCPDGSEPVNCFADPCEVTSCPAFPNARCVASFCGGCNATYFDENGNDVTSRCRDKCNSPIYPADFNPICDAIMERWTYNTTSRQCRAFDYPVCGEDREGYNVFETQSACEEACETQVCREDGVEYAVGQVFPAGDGCNNCTCLANGRIICTLIACRNPCLLEPEVGDCDGVFPRFFFDRSAEMCQRFNYGGCGGNRNNFETARECLQTCDRESVCNRPIYPPNYEPTCALIERQWTYNSTLGRCEAFTYSPCGEEREGYNVFDTERECNNTCVIRPEPTCDNIVNCFADPCSVTSCPNFPSARCVSNYCGGCNAWFFDSNGNNVTERCTSDTSLCELPKNLGSDDCSDDLPRLYYNSSVEVCQRFSYTGCGGNRNNFATGADCWDTCNPESKCNQPIYPRGFTPYCRVLIRVWTYNVTAAGCQEINYSPCGQEMEGYNVFRTAKECEKTCVRPPPPRPRCRDGSEPVNCFADPCEVSSCPAFPNARCVANFCGGCNATYFDENGNDVTSRCRVFLPTPIQVEVCPQVDSDSLGICPELCSSDEDCENGTLCCSNGCGHSCMAAVQVPFYDIPEQCPVDDSLLDICAISFDSDSCRSDEDCDDDELCCRSGCGRVCRESVRSTQPCFAITDLFNQTRSGSTSVLLGDRLSDIVNAYLPQCNSDGSFQPVQCHGSSDSRYCWCVHTRTGLPLSSPLRGKPKCSSCTFNGETYYAGQQFPSMDGCNDCFCSVNGAVACTERACIDTCSLDADPGPCRGAFPAYYYDDESGSCRRFTYGGCQGNDNKFKTIRDCFRRCDPDNLCLLRPDPGPCEALIPSLFFNATSGRCERFNYGGCQGNDNNFETGAACQRACDSNSPVDPCLDEECPGIEDCPDSRRVREPGECCAKCAPEECDDDQFLCSNGKCISSSFRCDGLTDCDEGEDEEDCPRTCDFMCGDGVCIPERYVCDGYLDCRDGSDARNCPTEFDNTFYPQDIPRQCPNATDLIGACVVECSGDDDCENGGLCCSNGCGRTCMRGEPVTPLCPALLRQTSSSLIGAFVPSCERDGSFSQVQCHGSTGFCWCVDTTSGQPLSEGVRGEPDCGGCTDHNDVTYGYGDSFLDEDGCNICYCTASFGALCTRRACTPEPCKIGDRIIEHNTSFTDDCVLCQCLFGELNCTKRPCAVTAAIRRRLTRIRMAFNGNFDDLLPSDDRIEEISRELRRTLQERYARLMGLLEEQVTDIKFEKGSVIVIITVNDTDSDTAGANITVLVAQLEQDYQAGNLVIRFNGEVLEPSGQIQVEDVTDTEDEVGFPWWGILIIVVGAVLFALGVVFFIVALIICCRKKTRGHSPLSDGADFGTDYEVPTKKGFDDTGGSMDLKKTPL